MTFALDGLVTDTIGHPPGQPPAWEATSIVDKIIRTCVILCGHISINPKKQHSLIFSFYRLLLARLRLGLLDLQTNPTVMVIQQLGKKSIQTHRGSSDVLRYIIKNVSNRLVRFPCDSLNTFTMVTYPVDV